MDKNGIQISDPVCCKLSGYLEQSNEGYHIIGSLTRLHMIVYCIFSINIMKYLAFTWGIRKDLLMYLMIFDCDVSSPVILSLSIPESVLIDFCLIDFDPIYILGEYIVLISLPVVLSSSIFCSWTLIPSIILSSMFHLQSYCVHWYCAVQHLLEWCIGDII